MGLCERRAFMSRSSSQGDICIWKGERYYIEELGATSRSRTRLALRNYRPVREVCWDLDPSRRAFYAERLANLRDLECCVYKICADKRVALRNMRTMDAQT